MRKKTFRPLAGLVAAAMLVSSIPAYALPAETLADLPEETDIEISVETEPQADAETQAVAEIPAEADTTTETESTEEIESQPEAVAESQDQGEETPQTAEAPLQKVNFDKNALADSATLAEGFIEKKFFGGNKASRMGYIAGDNLWGANYNLYIELSNMILEVAAGNRTSTEFQLDAEEIIGTYTAEELGVSAITSANVMELAGDIMNSNVDLGLVMNALANDMPYELFWFDKAGEGMGMAYGISYDSNELSITNLEITMAVSPDYQDGDAYTVDADRLQAVDEAVANAEYILSQAPFEDGNYTVMEYYREVICELTDYNYDAASPSYDGGYGDPWQMVYVFDGDPDTKVVCEGYAKAFQYLMDATAFAGNVSSYIVSGTMNGGAHMWNIVTNGYGDNYIVDVTSSDSLSVGYEVRRFLQVPDWGDMYEGYGFEEEEIEDDGTIYTLPESIYIYDHDTRNLYVWAQLNLAWNDYSDYDPYDPDDPGEIIIAGDLICGEVTIVEDIEDGDTFSFNFTAPQDGWYGIQIDDDCAASIHVMEDNDGYYRSPDEFYMNEGESTEVTITFWDDYESAPILVTKLNKIINITADLPEFLVRGVSDMHGITLHLYREDGSVTDVNLEDRYYFDEQSGKTIDVYGVYPNDTTISLVARVSGSGNQFGIGTTGVIPANDARVKKLNLGANANIPVSSLLNGHVASFTAPSDGYYVFRVRGNKTNAVDTTVGYGYEEDPGEAVGNEYVISSFVAAGDTIPLSLKNLGNNTSVSITVEKVPEVTELQMITKGSDILSYDEYYYADVYVKYADGSSETIPYTWMPLEFSSRSFRTNKGIVFSVLPGDDGLIINGNGINVYKELIVLPEKDYSNHYSGTSTVTEKNKYISVPDSWGDSYTYVKVVSQITGKYIFEEDSYVCSHIGLYEETGSTLKSVRVGEFYEFQLEKGKTYLLFLEWSYEETTHASEITLERCVDSIQISGFPAVVTCFEDLYPVQVEVTYGDGTKATLPLVDADKRVFDRDGLIEAGVAFGYRNDMDYEELLDEYLYSPDFSFHGYSLRDDLDYVFWFGSAYWKNAQVGDEINFRISRGRVEITEQPSNVTAALKDAVSFHVTAENAASYQWQYSKDGKSWVNSTVSSAKTDTLKLTVSASNAANIYRCKVTGKNGNAVYSETAHIELLPGAEIIAQPESPAMINGATVKFHVEANNVASYQWQYSKDGTSWKNSTLTSAKTDTLSIKVSDTNSMNIYRCKMTGTDGNTVNSNKVVFVLLTEQPKPCSAPIGTNASYSLKAENAASYQWQYSKDGGKTWSNSTLSSAKTDTLTFKVAVANQENLYRCKIKTVTGVYGYTTPVGYVDELKITTEPSDVTLAAGETATFKIAAAGKGLTYQWQYSKDNGKTWTTSTLASAKTATMKATVQASYDGRLYRCIVKDENGNSVTSRSAKVTIAGGPVITSQPADITTTAGSSVTFKVTATGTSLTYQWQYSKDNGKTWTSSTISSAKTAAMKTTVQASFDGRLYRCIITDGDGKTTTSASAKLTVK